MPDGPVGLRLDQRRALAGAGARGGSPHRCPDRDDVVAVDGDAWKAVGGGLAGDLGVERRHA